MGLVASLPHASSPRSHSRHERERLDCQPELDRRVDPEPVQGWVLISTSDMSSTYLLISLQELLSRV